VPVTLHIEVKKAATGFLATLVNGPDGASTVEFDDHFLRSRRVQQHLQSIEANVCRMDDIHEMGSELFVALFRGPIAEAYRAFCAESSEADPPLLKLSLPPQLARLPWEALYEYEAGEPFLGTRTTMSLVRAVTMPVSHDPSRPPTTALSVLVVIPDGAGLNVNQEWQNIRRIIERNSGVASVERLQGPVTPNSIEQKLRSKPWDVVHFIGHGMISADEESFSVILNDVDGGTRAVEGEAFASLFARNKPRLVVLNCCSGTAASPRRSLSGIGPALLRAGVAAVLAMRYEISDEDAITFTNSFYQRLLEADSPSLGVVNAAVDAARHDLYINKRDATLRAFITPVLFLSECYEQLLEKPAPAFLVEIRDRGNEEQDEPATEPAPVYSPDFTDCLEALREKECVLVLGPAMLASGRTRNAPAFPTMRDLGRQLSAECDFPWPDDGSLDDFAVATLLPWVCHQYQYKRERYRLIRTIARLYDGCVPPAVFEAVGKLQAPAVVYTHFDGLLETAMRNVRATFTAVSSLAHTGGVDITGTLLLCPTGTTSVPESLVLTEEEHERLHEDIGTVTPVIRARMHGPVGRCALFAGVSPRDPLARRMAARFLDTGSRRTQGPTYFVTAQHTPADDAYWEKYGVRWITESLDHVCESLVRMTA